MPAPTLFSRLPLRCAILLAVTLCLAPDVVGQGVQAFSAENEAMLQQVRRQSLQQALSGETVPLEGALDPQEYIVGPGDVFAVSVDAVIPVNANIPVSADGLLVVPEVGTFDVAGLTLAEARRRVAEGLLRSYRNVDSAVALARPRQFYVHVAGAVPQPGRHVVAPVARVEDAVAAAMGEQSPLSVLRMLRREAGITGEQALLPALRSVEVRRRDGTVDRVDLQRYYTSGDLTFNPYVRDGDAIYVPTFRDDASAVAVEGEVSNPGVYSYRADDTVLDLLAVATGTGDYDALGPVRLISRGEEAQTLDAVEVASGRADNPALQPGDRLLVLPPDLSAGVASVVGYVEFPGSYPIVTDETTLRQLVEDAGGLRPNALVRGAYLERRGITRSALYEPDQIRPSPALPLDADINPQVAERIITTEVNELTRFSDLSYTSRQYFGRELLEPQRLSVDVGAVLRGEADDLLLQDGDRLVVPRDPGAVLVVGQVMRPGYVPVQPGADVEYYIEQAGGRGESATGTYVRDANTGRIRAPQGVTQSGDYILVDGGGIIGSQQVQALALQERGLELQEERETNERRFRYVQLASTLATTAAVLLSTYITLRNN